MCNSVGFFVNTWPWWSSCQEDTHLHLLHLTTLVRPRLLPAPLTPLPSIGPLSVSHLGHSKGFITSTVHPLSLPREWPLHYYIIAVFGSLLPTRLCPGSEVCALPDLRPIYLPASSTSCHSPHIPTPFPLYPTHCNLPPSLPLKCLPTHHLGDPFPNNFLCFSMHSLSITSYTSACFDYSSLLPPLHPSTGLCLTCQAAG